MCINFFTGFIICNGEHPPMNMGKVYLAALYVIVHIKDAQV